MARGAHYLNRGFGDEQYGFFCNPTKQVISRLASTIHTNQMGLYSITRGVPFDRGYIRGTIDRKYGIISAKDYRWIKNGILYLFWKVG